MRADTNDQARAALAGLPVFQPAGLATSGDYVCSECGYGVSVRVRLPACPMCGGEVWEDARTSALASWAPAPSG